jgi:hypothetical protein
LTSKICHLLLRACAGGFAGIRDLRDHAVEPPIAIGVDRDVGLIADLHRDDVVLVHVHASFHATEIRHPHHFGPGELVRRHDALADLAVQQRHDAVDR